jgi:hypothetical protein
MKQPVRLKASTDYATVTPGRCLTIELEIQNAGTSTVQGCIDLIGLEASWYDLTPSRVTIPPDSDQHVQVHLHPPAEAMAGRYPISMRLRSEDGHPNQASIRVDVLVGPDQMLRIDVDPLAATGMTATFRVTFVNQMSFPITLSLSARDRGDRLRFRVTPTQSLVVPAKATAGPVNVKVIPRARPIFGEPKPYEIELRGLGMGLQTAILEPAIALDPHLVAYPRFTYVPPLAVSRLLAHLLRVLGSVVLVAVILVLLTMLAK